MGSETLQHALNFAEEVSNFNNLRYQTVLIKNNIKNQYLNEDEIFISENLCYMPSFKYIPNILHCRTNQTRMLAWES